MQKQFIQCPNTIRLITPAFPQTPFSFRQLINVRPWHAITSADEDANHARGSGRARPKSARWRRLGFLGLLAAGLLAGGGVQASQSVSISWNASTNAGVAGYTFFRGTNSGVYISQYNLGTNTTITLTGLKEGQMNYFTVAAYDSAGAQSPPSAEITYLVPGLVSMGAPSGPGNAGNVRFSAAIGHTYIVEASTDLKTWTNVWSSGTVTSNAWITWQDPQTTLPKRFYRLIMQ